MAYYQRDQLSIKTRTKLANYFGDLIVISQSLQSFRNALAEIEHFNGIQLFRYLDKDQKGYLSPYDFATVISDQVKKILHYAYGWFDISKSGQITKLQFLQFLFPRQDPVLREAVSLRMQYPSLPSQKQSTLSIQLTLFRSLLLQLMQKQTHLIPKRRFLMDQQDYSLKGVMNCLDVDGRGWVTLQDIYKFMKNYDIDVEVENVRGFIGVYDCDLDGKIQMEELEWLVEGLEKRGGKYRAIVRESGKKGKKVEWKSQGKARTVQRKSEKGRKNQTTNKKKKSQFTENSHKKVSSKLDFGESVKNSINNKNVTKNQTSNKKSQQSGNKIEKNLISNQFIDKNGYKQQEYQQLKRAFTQIQKQNIKIDNELKKHQQQIELNSQIEMQRRLQLAQKRRIQKIEQKQNIRQKIIELETLRKQQQRRRFIEMQNLRLEQSQRQRLRSLQIEREMIKKQQDRRIRQTIEQNRLRNMQFVKNMQIARNSQRETTRLISKTIQSQLLKQQAEKQKQMIDKKIQLVRQLQNQQIQKARLQMLKNEDQQSEWNKTKKQSDYFLKYSRYQHHLSEIKDPLGIKQHLLITDQHLQKSKLLREQVKKDRAYSLNRYPNYSLKRNFQRSPYEVKQRTITESRFQGTPQTRQQVNQSANKGTEQTKLMWS